MLLRRVDFDVNLDHSLDLGFLKVSVSIVERDIFSVWVYSSIIRHLIDWPKIELHSPYCVYDISKF